MRNRFLALGLGLSLSILLCGPGRAEGQPLDPDPGGGCRAFRAPWRLPCIGLNSLAAIPVSRDPWAVLQNTPGVLVDRIDVGGRESGCSLPAPIVEVGVPVGQGFPGVDEMLATDMAAAGLAPSELDFNAYAETPAEMLELGTGPG